MYVQVKTIRNIKYVYIVENRRRRSDGKIVRKTVERLGRLDILEKDNPTFLSDLKEQLIKKGEIVKAEQAVYTKIIMKDTQEIKDNYCGYPFMYFSNFPIRYIFSSELQLTYYFKYLQKTKYEKLQFNLEQFIYHQILMDIVPDAVTRNLPNAFVNDCIDLDAEDKFLDIAKQIVFENHDRFVKFINARRKSSQQDFLDLRKSVEEKFKDDELSNYNKDTYFSFFKTLIKDQLLTYLKNQLKNGVSLDCTKDQILDALNNARLIKLRPVEESLNTNVYIKIAHKSSKLMDIILRIFRFEAIENAQVERELFRKLGIRSDTMVYQDKNKDVLEEEQYKPYVKEDPKDDPYAAARRVFFI